jgi:hypothetical protein
MLCRRNVKRRATMLFAMATTVTDIYKRDRDALAGDVELALLLSNADLEHLLELYMAAFNKQLRQGALGDALQGLGVLDRPLYKFLKFRLQPSYPELAESRIYWKNILETALGLSNCDGIDDLLGYCNWLDDIFNNSPAAACEAEWLFKIAHSAWFKASPHKNRRKTFAGFLVRKNALSGMCEQQANIAGTFLLDLLQRAGEYRTVNSGVDVLSPDTLRALAGCAMEFVGRGVPVLYNRFGEQQAGFILRQQGFRIFSYWVHSRSRQVALKLQQHKFFDNLSHSPLPVVRMLEWAPPVVLGNVELVPYEFLAHLSQGHSLRSAPRQAFPLTARAAHYFTQLRAEDSWDSAFIKSRVESLGGSVYLTRELHLHAWRLQEWQDDDFVTRLIEFFVRFKGRIPPSQVRPLVDFLHDCRQRRRDFSLKGRTPEALMRQMYAWHEELALNAKLAQMNATWEPAPVPGLDYTDKEKRRFRIVQLTTAKELSEEGKALRHCVAIYAGRAAKGQCSIWSMQLENPDSGVFERRVTIELSRKYHIVQVRGLHNRLPDALDIKVLQIWKHKANLP